MWRLFLFIFIFLLVVTYLATETNVRNYQERKPANELAKSQSGTEYKIKSPPSSVNLFARDFFQPKIDPNDRRDSFPERLTFSDPLIVSQDDFAKMIQGTWQILPHCNGRPIGDYEASTKRFFDGHYNRSAFFTFRGDRISRFTPKTNSIGEKPLPSSVDGKDFSFDNNRFTIFRRENTVTKFEVVPANYTRMVFELRRIVETGETVIYFSDYEDWPACEDGSQPRFILVPTANS